MLLAELIDASERVSQTRSRLAKIEALAQVLKRLDPAEIEIGVSYLSGDALQSRLGVGYAALKDAAQTTPAPTSGLDLGEIDHVLAAVASVQGPGSAGERRRLLRALFERATSAEQGFLFRLLLGELRQGALEGVMIEAIARAADLTPAEVRLAAMRAGGPARSARLLLTEGRSGMAHFRLAPFQPVLPMLAQPAQDTAQALERLGTAAFEWKLDGVRVQVHKSGGQVRVYSRSLNEVTAAVPEITEAAQRVAASAFIVDGETIALKPDGRPQPFQETMRRFGRKLDVQALRSTLPLSVVFFDCLLLDGEDLTAQAAHRRFEALDRIAPGDLVVARLVTSDPVDAKAFFDSSLRRGHEGVMAKALDAPYEAGGRGGAWLKIKQARTLDLVVLAAEWGNGRRAGWLSNLHLGARESAGGFAMLGKTFKGMTDRMLEWQTARLLELEVRREQHVVHVRPELVVEIAFNEIQASPHYPAGVALRFARVKRYREDKQANDADTVDTVLKLYNGQLHRQA